MNTDTTFITNESNFTLQQRFKVLIKDTRFFDVLVGYFYPSGFHAIYESLEKAEHIRILVGIGTNKQTYDLVQAHSPFQTVFQFSHAQVKETLEPVLIEEMEKSEDTPITETGIRKFTKWLDSGKLEIKAYPSENIHAKLYIMTFNEGDKDKGRVITGSSNFTQAGLIDNLEFNVELKDSADYKFAMDKFNELWTNAVDLKDTYLDAIQTRSWINDTITPYELYLKFLYEYFKDKISRDVDIIETVDYPEDFMELDYQKDAVKDAKSRLETYGGVFLADVVGLGKTYISALLAKQLSGRNLVIAPPGLLDEENPGSWKNVFNAFKVSSYYESIGSLEKIIEKGTGRYQNVFIDEAHRFRNEDNQTYEKLAQICAGKRVILVSATPLNNSPQDIFSQIKFFQKARKSTIPNLPDLEKFFSGLNKKLNGLDRQTNHDEYMKVVGENAKEIREKILNYLMVRRTRSEIIKYFNKDLKKQGFKFPDVENPSPEFYQLDANEEKVFNRTIELVTSKFKYTRYTPLLHLNDNISQPLELSQKNMMKFMKILLVKRLESSFYAFRQSIGRFVNSYEQFIKAFDSGKVYVSKKYSAKLFEAMENDDDTTIQRLIEEDKAVEFDSTDFKPGFRDFLESDLTVLREIEKLWKTITRDPKLLKLQAILKSETVLKENKLILFTESRETAEYLYGNLAKTFPHQVIVFSGSSNEAVRKEVIANYDANAKNRKDDYRILITTEVLAEGVNLHRSNVVLNYDIPWNPARLMQRVGRINRVNTKFDKIYTYNFFPTSQSNDQIKLKESAEAKIQGFIEMLGADARLLTEGEEIKSHDLFARLNSTETITGENSSEDSELRYLEVIRNLRDADLDLFEKIKKLPKKARTGRSSGGVNIGLLTYFRRGKLHKFYIKGEDKPQELDFLAAARIVESEPATPREKPGTDYFQLLEANKLAFLTSTSGETPVIKYSGGRSSGDFVLKVLKSKDIRQFKGFTEEDEAYISDLICLISEGGLPKQTAKNLAKLLEKEIKPLKILGILRQNMAPEFFNETQAESSAQTSGPREVILSEYLVNK